MENYLENTEILSPELLQAIDELLAQSKEIVFGGSIALNAVGVIKSEVISAYFTNQLSLGVQLFC